MKTIQRVSLLAALLVLGYALVTRPIFQTVAAGVAIFLFGMLSLEQGFQALTGGILERVLARWTNSLAKSLSLGFGATALMQSSSLVTVITISTLTAGMITLTAGIGIIFGANIGTTTGAWIMAGFGLKVDIAKYAMPVIVLGLVLILQKKNEIAGLGNILAGIGFVLLGIHYMKAGSRDSASPSTWRPTPCRVSGSPAVHAVRDGRHRRHAIEPCHVDDHDRRAGGPAGDLRQCVGPGDRLEHRHHRHRGYRRAGRQCARPTTGLGARDVQRSHRRRGNHLHRSIQMGWMESPGLGMGRAQLDAAIRHVPHAVQRGRRRAHDAGHRPASALLEEQVKAEPRVEEQGVALGPQYLNASALALPDTALKVLLQESRHLFAIVFEVIAQGLNLRRTDILSERDLSEVVNNSSRVMNVDVTERYYNSVKTLYSAIVDFATRAPAASNMNEEQISRVQSIRLACRDAAEIIKLLSQIRPNLNKYMVSDNAAMKEQYNLTRKNIAPLLAGDHEVAGCSRAGGHIHGAWEPRAGDQKPGRAGRWNHRPARARSRHHPAHGDQSDERYRLRRRHRPRFDRDRSTPGGRNGSQSHSRNLRKDSPCEL